MSENHVRRFMGGLQTPQEVFRSHAFPKGAACASCKGPPAARFTVYVLWDDAVRRDPTLLLMDEGALAAITVRLKQGRAIRISNAYACERCRPAAERYVAKNAPSYAFVDIDAGPEPTNRVVVGPTSF